MATNDAAGVYRRDTDYLATRITRDGADGYTPDAGRYRLVAARACPWANRAQIVRRLLGLESAISLAVAGPLHDARSWNFDDEPGGVDAVLGISHLAVAYDRRIPANLTGGEIIDLLGRLRKSLDPKRRDRLIERFDLGQSATSPGKQAR